MTFETFFPEEAEKERKERLKHNKKNPPKVPSLGTFQPIVMPVTRRLAPQLLANQIVGVQPMHGPTGKMFKWDSLSSEKTPVYTNPKFRLKRSIKFYNEKHKWKYLTENIYNIKHIPKPTKAMLWYCVSKLGIEKTMELHPHPILDIMNL